jgi:hypothetical protein
MSLIDLVRLSTIITSAHRSSANDGSTQLMWLRRWVDHLDTADPERVPRAIPQLASSGCDR